MENQISRRNFLNTAALGVTTAATALSAKSYGKVKGANDRINIGFIGCGSRSRGHRRMVNMLFKEKNLDVVAVCDLWKQNRELAAADCKTKFGTEPSQFKYSEDMLVMPQLDAVMIATGDHQHGYIMAEVVKAGKDCYCEKPMAIDVDEAKASRAAVLGTKQVVQIGSQWSSDPYQIKIRDIVRSGKLGQITKIEQNWNDNNHRWHDEKDPDITAIREEDTDWQRWLLSKPYRPFNPWIYFEFRIFRDFSGGITSQWMSHGIQLVHFYTDTAIPDSMTASGGIYAWPDIRQNPDTLETLATYEDAKFLYSYSSTYGNRFGDFTCIRGKDATLYCQGGEGATRWFFIPEQLKGRFDFYGGFQDAVKNGKAHIVTLDGQKENELPPYHSEDSRYHMENWVECMRSRNFKTNSDIHSGFWHSIGTIMATRSYREGKKLYWDRQKEEIIDHPPIQTL